MRRVFSQHVICIEGWESVRQAAKRMHEAGISCLPVVSGDDLLGIITERDVVEAMADSATSAGAAVVDYMTETPRTISPEDDITLAATQMLATGCRHLPVVEDGKLVGIVSARDLLPLATSAIV